MPHLLSSVYHVFKWKISSCQIYTTGIHKPDTSQPTRPFICLISYLITSKQFARSIRLNRFLPNELSHGFIMRIIIDIISPFFSIEINAIGLIQSEWLLICPLFNVAQQQIQCNSAHVCRNFMWKETLNEYFSNSMC